MSKYVRLVDGWHQVDEAIVLTYGKTAKAQAVECGRVVKAPTVDALPDGATLCAVCAAPASDEKTAKKKGAAERAHASSGGLVSAVAGVRGPQARPVLPPT